MARSRTRSPSPRGGSRHHGSPDRRAPSSRRSPSRDDTLPTSLLVRNLARTARQEEVRAVFERYGPVRDVYLPRDYYTRELKGFGFVQFEDGRDASEAQYKLDRTMIGGREVSVVFAEQGRKRPEQMRDRDRVVSRGPPPPSRHDRGRRRSPSPPRRRRSPSPENGRGRYDDRRGEERDRGRGSRDSRDGRDRERDRQSGPDAHSPRRDRSPPPRNKPEAVQDYNSPRARSPQGALSPPPRDKDPYREESPEASDWR